MRIMTGPRNIERVTRRRSARQAGLATYNPGVPCSQGHAAERHVGNDRCVACQRISNRGTRDLRSRNKDKDAGIEPRPRLRACPPRPDRCQCCGSDRKLVLDHCHVSGAFRGWICDRCNRGLGCLGDNVPGLCHAILYLLTVSGRRPGLRRTIQYLLTTSRDRA